MRVLLDTNILFDREDPRAPPAGLTDLLRIAQENAVSVVVHPSSLREAARDQNEERRLPVTAKLKAYPVLEALPAVPPEFRQAAGGASTPNGEVDIELLFALKCEAAAILITEDKGLLGRAARLDLEDRVLSIQLGRSYLSDLFERRLPAAPAYLEEVPVYALDRDDPLFDSVKNDYIEFPDWFRRIQREGRQCARVLGPDGRLGAVVIYKEESGELLDRPPIRRVKISTLKVADSVSGLRISELLLSYIFHYCRVNGIDECYVTVFPQHDDVVGVLAINGFHRIGQNERGEFIMVKSFGQGVGPEDLSPTDYVREFYPRFRDDPEVRKFLVPIQPAFHTMLFPEYVLGRLQKTLDGFIGPTHPAGNAIRKAYICNAATREIRPGDLLLFYRSQDARRVTHLGVVEKVTECEQVEHVLSIVGNRTVFPIAKLKSLCSKKALVLLFWNIGPVSGIRRPGPGLFEPDTAPQSITRIEDWNYRVLMGS